MASRWDSKLRKAEKESTLDGWGERRGCKGMIDRRDSDLSEDIGREAQNSLQEGGLGSIRSG